MHRFFLPNLQQPALSAAEAHHALHVLRLKVGDTLNAFDGRGHEAQCAIAEITKDTVRLKVLTQTTTPALPFRITLAQAIPKKSMDLIVQKATELGVASIVPLASERTLVKLDDDSKKMDRWREIALESCKQCGNNWLPEIQPPQKARGFLEALAEIRPQTHRLTATGRETAQDNSFRRFSTRSIRDFLHPLILIGPEGDFTPAELNLAKSAGCLPLSLGPLVLRAETAAIYTLSILHHELQNR